jgi:hypothetical protein
MLEKNLQPVSEVDPELNPGIPDHPHTPEDTFLGDTPPDLDFKMVTRSLSKIKAHERPIKQAPKEQEVRQKIRKVPAQRRAAGDPITSIRQANNSRRR